MRKTYILLATAVLLLLVLALVACQPTVGNGDETTEIAETADGSETAAETKAEKETETELPRLDYFEADMSDYVTIDPEAYQTIKVTLAEDLQVTDAEIQRYIRLLQFQERSEAVESETMVDEMLEWGDDAYIYYTGYIDGEPFDKGSNAEDDEPFMLGLGSSEFIPGFEDGLIGVIPSRTSKENPAKVYTRFPSWYSNSKVAGKDVMFEVYVVYAVEHEIPDYDVDFVTNDLMYKFKKDEYVSDAAKLKEFEASVKEHLEENMEETVNASTYKAIKEHLMSNATFKALPEEEIAYYRHYYMSVFEEQYDYYKTYGYEESFEVFVREAMGLPADGDWEAEMTRAVTESVKYDVIQYAIAQLEGIKTVTEEEMDEELEYWIGYYQDNYGTAVSEEEILANRGEDTLRRSAFDNKMYEFLLGKATVTYGDAAESEPPAEEETEAVSETVAEETTAA